MENKQKPSNLYMVPTHHDFNNHEESKLFKKEMLEWPIFNFYEDKEITDSIFIKIHRNALEALTMISPFSSIISMGVNLTEERLLMADKRTWGEIYFNDKHILSFSHDTRESRPFNYLFEWPELDNEYSVEEWKRVKNILYSWDTEQWKNFFIQRLKERAKFLLNKADAKKKDVLDLEESAHQMLFALI